MYGLSLNLSIDMPGAITRVESPSHPFSISIQGSKASAHLAQRDVPLDRDVVVVVAADGLNEPHAWIEMDDAGRCAAAVVFRPGLDRETSPSEIVFVVDRSGSMRGTSIAEVPNALQLCLRSLTTECRFNIVGFGSSFAALFPESRRYSEASLAEASAHVATLDADLGGTEILPRRASCWESCSRWALRGRSCAERRGSDQYRCRPCARPRSRQDDPCVLVRHRRRRQPPPGEGHGEGRRRRRRVHSAGRTD